MRVNVQTTRIGLEPGTKLNKMFRLLVKYYFGSQLRHHCVMTAGVVNEGAHYRIEQPREVTSVFREVTSV